MLKKIVSLLCILIGSFLSACGSAAAAIDDPAALIGNTAPAQATPRMPENESTETSSIPSPAPVDDPLAQLKGKVVKDDQGYLLLLGLSYIPNQEVNYYFLESMVYPHEHVTEDFRILDGNGVSLEFEEIDPYEMNLLVEQPLGEGIMDPRVFRIIPENIQGPLTLELVNLVREVNLSSQPLSSFTIRFDSDFPSGKNNWEINQSVDLIPGHPFTLKYFDATVFNEFSQGQYGGPNGTFFNGTYYLEAAGFEGISFSQVVLVERQNEWPLGGGGAVDTCSDVFSDCIMSDAGLLKTEDNTYELEITAYRLVVHGPWQAKFDLP